MVQQSRQGTICLEQLSVMHGCSTFTGSSQQWQLQDLQPKGQTAQFLSLKNIEHQSTLLYLPLVRYLTVACLMLGVELMSEIPYLA